MKVFVLHSINCIHGIFDTWDSAVAYAEYLREKEDSDEVLFVREMDVQHYPNEKVAEHAEHHDLKHCPFCGSKARMRKTEDYFDFNEGYIVECTNNSCVMAPETCLCETEEEAIAQWNTRAGEEDEK